MKQSQLLYKALREAPKDEVSANAQLLIKAGFVQKVGAGIYNFLPLGFKVLKKIEGIIREEMVRCGGQEILMAAMHPKEYWLRTGRWDTYEDLYKLKDDDRELALGPTHEEIVVPLAKKLINGVQDLPIYLFQIQTKFRKEKRAKSGLLRGREFMMKDLYSFHANENDLDTYYEKMKAAYSRIFKKAGLGSQTFLTYASGGTFSKYSHEFQTLTPAGEDIIYLCQKCFQAINREIKDEITACPNCQGTDFKEEKAIEVGNIFKLKTKYSEPFGLKFKNAKGEEKTVMMGCYGIGLGRLMGTVVEVLHDSKGIVWPEAVSPFDVHLIQIGGPKVAREANKIYKLLEEQGIEVLYDDRDKSGGEKLVEADLIGIPLRLVISERTLETKSGELKKRDSAKTKLVKITELENRIVKLVKK